MTKHYFSISEVEELTSLKPHIIRYWEKHIPQLNPIKTRGGKRRYKKEHIELLLRIKKWIYEEGYTLQGVKSKLKKNPSTPLSSTLVTEIKKTLKEILTLLKDGEI